jgi:3-hydroxymyristoyl/3-hydroxydecanoyl-(acyl carrier protein) dehydratase
MIFHDDTRHRVVFTIPADHPALPGHFPGDPVVPGVLILDEVRLAAEHWLGCRQAIRRLPQGKFVAPMLPGETATIELARAGNTLSFSVTRDEVIVAKGTFELSTVTAP